MPDRDTPGAETPLDEVRRLRSVIAARDTEAAPGAALDLEDFERRLVRASRAAMQVDDDDLADVLAEAEDLCDLVRRLQAQIADVRAEIDKPRRKFVDVHPDYHVGREDLITAIEHIIEAADKEADDAR